MANQFFPKGKQKILDAQIDFDTNTIKARLVKSTYVYDAAHEFVSSVPAITGTTDQTLAGKSITNGVFDADDVTWAAVSPDPAENASAVVLFKLVTNDADSPLIAIIDTITGFPLATNGGDVVVQWSNGANKIFSL